MVDIGISSAAVFFGSMLREEPQQGDVILPIVADAAQVAEFTLAVYCFIEDLIVDVAVYAYSVV